MGELQLLPRHFYALTWSQYNCRVRGYLRLEEEKWEHTRLLYSILYNTNVKEGAQRKPEQLVPLRKDRQVLLRKPAGPPPLTKEQLIARIKQRDNLA